jgi:Protein of unknown function (DUF1064)
VIDGRRFDSRAEGRRYEHLKAEQAAGRIAALRCQVRFVLRVNGHRVGAYWADFQYVRAGRLVTEDVKGVRTPMFALKKKLVAALYGIDIIEVK